MNAVVKIDMAHVDEDEMVPWAIWPVAEDGSTVTLQHPLDSGRVEAHDEVREWVDKLDLELMDHGWQRMAEPTFMFWWVLARVRKV